MTLFAFNSKSILNNGFARGVNAVSLLFLFACGFSIDNDLVISPKICILVTFATSILTVFVTYYAYKKTEFYEWDYTERQKKKRFVFTYFFMCSILSTMFVYSVIAEYFIVTETDVTMDDIMKWLGAIPVVLLAFNLCNIPSLFYPVFMGDLEVGCKIQEKPKGWQDNGQEIGRYDATKDILHRDFNI